MAIKPNENDAFLREVDEELRKEKLNQFFTRYGWAVIGGVVLLLAAIGGWIWWQDRQDAQAAAQGEALLEALESLQAGSRDAASPKIDELAESNIEGYRVAALFARAGIQVESGETEAAVATLAAIAENEDFAEPYRQAALVRQTALQFDSLPPAQVIQRLQPLAEAESAWYGAAGEMVAIAYMKLNQPERAGPIFAGIAGDETVPPSIRTRAVQMAGSLGIDAVEDEAGTAAPAQGAAGADAAATKEESE